MTDIVERLNDSLSAGYSELRKEAAVEIMRLRAKITEMERQEPVARVLQAVIMGRLGGQVVPPNPEPRLRSALPPPPTQGRQAWTAGRCSATPPRAATTATCAARSCLWRSPCPRVA